MSRASRSPERRAARVCRSKKRYDTVQDAAIAAGAYLFNNGSMLHTYECGDHFHLTSKINDQE